MDGSAAARARTPQLGAETPKPTGSAGEPKKSVGTSSSDSSITASSASHSSKKNTTTSETQTRTTEGTSTDTGGSTTQYSKDADDTVQSSEQSTGETGQSTGETGQSTGEAGQSTGEAEQSAGEAEQSTGEAGQSTGEAEQSTGETGQSTGEAEQSTGEAEQSTGEAEQSTGEAEQSTGETGQSTGEAEQSANEASAETSSTADNSSVSASDPKFLQSKAEKSGSEDKPVVSLPHIPEVASISDSRRSEIAHPGVGAVVDQSDKSQQSAVQENTSKQSAVQENKSTNALVLIPEMQNLNLNDPITVTTSSEDTSEYVYESDSIAASHNQETYRQACTQADNGKPKGFTESQPQFTSTSVIVAAGSASTAERTTSGDQNREDPITIGHGDPDLPKLSGDAAGARPKVREMPPSVFRSLIYGDEPDPAPLSIFAGNPLMASQEEVIIVKERIRDQSSAVSKTDTTVKGDKVLREGMQDDDPTKPRTVAGSHESRTGDASNVPSCAGRPSSSRDAGEESELLGACGGSSRPRTVQEIIGMQGVQEMHAVQPLTWCPHLTEVRPLPQSDFSPHDPCRTCGDVSENWVCLTCYAVECSRFVNEHMLMHRLETGHNMVLSYSDLSVWCYGCDHYVDNEVLFPMKNAAHEIKFGESYI